MTSYYYREMLFGIFCLHMNRLIFNLYALRNSKLPVKKVLISCVAVCFLKNSMCDINEVL